MRLIALCRDFYMVKKESWLHGTSKNYEKDMSQGLCKNLDDFTKDCFLRFHNDSKMMFVNTSQ